MKKIPTLFQRNHDGDRLVRNEVTPGAEWVASGEGYATRKFDGTSCMVRDGKFFKRYDVKNDRSTPADFIPSQDPDPVTGHWPGWVPVGEGPEDQWHREAFGCSIAPLMEKVSEVRVLDGLFELVGPKVQGNPEKFSRHALLSLFHEDRIDDFANIEAPEPPRDFDGLKAFLAAHDIEGIVWHHPDGRMVKLKGKDFGLKR